MGDPSEADRERAAAALAAVRSAVLQRRAEVATVGAGGDELARELAELRQREMVDEPKPVSPRRGLGRWIVFARKAVYHLFGKWHVRAVLQQQNEFNQSAVAVVAALVERERALRAELSRLRARLDQLEGRPQPPGAVEPPA